jgi:hypothetical protein
MSNLPPTMPQSLINLIGEYGFARTDGASEIERIHRWELLIDGIKLYAGSYAEEAVRLERERSNKLRDTLMLIRNHTSVTANQIEMIDAAVRALWDQRWTEAIRARSQEGQG